MCEKALSLSLKRGAVVTPSRPHWMISLSNGNFHVRPPGQEGTAGAPWPALFLSGPRRPRPSQSGLEWQPTLHWLRSENSGRGLQTIKSRVPRALATFCSKQYVVCSFVPESCRRAGSRVLGASLTPAQALPTKPRGQGKAHPWLFQAELGALTLRGGSCWT